MKLHHQQRAFGLMEVFYDSFWLSNEMKYEQLINLVHHNWLVYEPHPRRLCTVSCDC